MQVLFIQNLNAYWQKKVQDLRKEFPDVEIIENIKKEDRISFLKNADIIIGYKLSMEEIENAINLKAVFVPYTGLDNFPVAELQKRNIIISNTHANSKYVAEKAVSLSLALLGRIVELHNKLTKGIWELDLEPPNYWNTLQNKTCAILGYGQIGQNIERFIKPYDCKVIAFKKHSLNLHISDSFEVTTDLNYAIHNSEIIYLCLPLSPETKEIISKDLIMTMKGKYLINVGRGALINEEGLYSALKNKVLAGAAIDVWYNYPSRTKQEPVFPSKYPIHELDNVVISPHKSGYTKESVEGMIEDTVNNLKTYLKTGKMRNAIKDYY